MSSDARHSLQEVSETSMELGRIVDTSREIHMIEIHVQLFAAVRTAAGSTMVALRVEGSGEGVTIARVRERLADRVPLVRDLIRRSLFAVNDDFAADDRIVRPEDQVACIPPVSGG